MALVTETPVRFVICGFGHIGQRHAAMIAQNPESTLAAVIDIDPAMGAVAALYGAPIYPTLENYLADGPAAEVLTIATPNNCHAAQALQGIAAGYHVVLEKPMGLTKASCEAVLFAALQAQRLVFCVMQNRYSPPAVWLKEVVMSGILGQLYLVQVNCYWNRDHRYYIPGGWKGRQATDGGTLFTQFSHFVDMVYWLFGDVTNIEARFYDFNHAALTEFEDSGLITFQLPGGAAGSFNYSTAVYDANLESSLTLLAQHGSIKVGGQYMNQVQHCHIKNYQMPTLPEASPANDYGHYKGSAANHHYVIENVVNTLKGRTVATTNALEGLKVVEIIENIYAKK